MVTIEVRDRRSDVEMNDENRKPIGTRFKSFVKHRPPPVRALRRYVITGVLLRRGDRDVVGMRSWAGEGGYTITAAARPIS